MTSFDDKERRTLVNDERRTLVPEEPRRTVVMDDRRTVNIGTRDAPGSSAGTRPLGVPDGTPGGAPGEAPTLGRGTPLDRYVVLDPLGEGGMGMVYAAYDSVLDRKVALKLLPPGEVDGGPEVSSGRARLLREAQAMARLSHPNVVAIYDVHQHESQVFMAMELVDGQTLLQWEREKPRTWRELLTAYLSAGRGLAAAHAAGLVHRDFKPTNVLVGKDGRVRVTDFGLARPHNAPPEQAADAAPDTSPVKAHSLLELNLTQRGAVLGTPAYMAPEQFRGATADARSDQFSFAVSLWEALYGVRPFEGTSPGERRENVLAGRIHAPPPYSKVPPWVNRALLRALNTAPEARYPSLDALLAVLERDPARVRRRALAITALGLLVTGSAVLAWTTWQQRQAQLCTGGAAKLVGIWDAPRKAAIEKAFFATGRDYARDTWVRVREALDAYTREWQEMHHDTCAATRIRGEQSEDVMSLRMACLEGRRQELAALSEVFADADETVVEKAIFATSSLRRLWGCADVEALMSEVKPPEDANTRRAVETVRAQLARVKALNTAGKLPESLELATEVAKKAPTLGYSPVHAEALFTQAWVQILAAENQGVPPLLTEALWLAHASRHDTIVAAAAVRLMGYYAQRGPEEEAKHWQAFALASLDRLGENGELRAIYHNNRGMAFYAQGNFAEAYESFDKAFALAEQTLGPAHSTTLRYATNSLAALGNLDRMDESLRALESLVSVGEQNLGPLHPFLVQPMMNLSSTYVMQGRLADARRILDRVREIVKRAFRPNSEEWAHYHLSAGELDSEQGRDAEALEHYQEAARLYGTLTGPESADALQSLVRVAEAQMALERLGQARQTFQQVLELTKKDPQQQEHIYTQALNGLAALHTVRGQHDKALKLHQQVLELRERFLGADHFNTLLIRMDVANSLLEMGQAAKALALFEQVRVLFEKTTELDSPVGALLLAGTGEALRKLGRTGEAIPLLERALVIVGNHKGRPEYQALVQSALARALWNTGQQLERVQKLAAAARAIYARTPILRANELAQLDAVLKRYEPKTPPLGAMAQPTAP